MSSSAIAERSGISSSPKALKLSPPPTEPARGPVPEYRPSFYPGDVPLNDPRRARLDELRKDAWQRGISNEELNRMECGGCPNQIEFQTRELTAWLVSRA